MENRWLTRIRNALAGLLLLVCLLLLFLFGGRPAKRIAYAAPVGDETIYSGGIQNGWADWSWAERNPKDTGVTYQGKASFRFNPSQFKGVLLHHTAFFTEDYQALIFAIHGGTKGGQKLWLCAVDAANKFGTKIPVENYLPGKTIPAGRFATGIVPLKELGLGKSWVSGISFQAATNDPQPSVYLAEIRLVAGRKAAQAPRSIVLTVNAKKRIGPISPLIYGMAASNPDDIKTLRLGLSRWGGNPNTRYNWELGNAWNAARDYYFRNGNYGNTKPEDKTPSAVADRGIARTLQAGAQMYLTIPTMGWVAKNDDQRIESSSVPKETGPPVAPGSEAIAGYDPTYNRERVSVRSLPRKGRPFADPPDKTDTVVYQDEWVNHLVRRFGKAGAGGVRYYAMDNEPDLWDSTHTDMHPVRPDYDELLQKFLDAADAIKDVDPTAQIGGPVSWGWTGFFYSPRDRGSDNYRTAADRKAHGNLPFVPWFLQQVAAHDKRKGRRTLDVLDVHLYPQGTGLYPGRSDSATNALRLRSTRALWDKDYTDESWIATPIQLLPRLKQWVRDYYPGTKIGLMEWNWGADNTLNGGLAAAEVLGIFGREQLDMAAYWTAPGKETPGWFAFKMFRNADGNGNGFGDVAVASDSTAPEQVSCFGSLDTKTGQPAAMLVNKQPDAITVTVKWTGAAGSGGVQGFRYSGAALKSIETLPKMTAVNGQLKLLLPAYSLTLLRGSRP